MYPSTELDALALRKLLICARIRVRRQEMAAAGARIAVPLSWVDQAWAKWKAISPFLKMAAVPLAFTAKKALFPRIGLVGKLMRWAPAALGAFRFFSAMRQK